MHRELKTSIVYVTHDQTEAMTLADKIVVLRDGRVEQIGSPMTLYNDPDNLFVASFLGSPSMNFLDATILGYDQAKTVGIRPEHLAISDTGKLSGEVTHIEQLGSDTNVYVKIDPSHLITVRLFGQQHYELGSTVHLTFEEQQIFLFDDNDSRMR